ncbi:flagellar protein export ATPase FliI [Bacillus carboniphilus]|uniref:Flagellar protein export ATPase FliI n=1 Tax=Bacillus carboniphilus TaxID=86663 RepID=A0ABP3G1T8_9BACI
MRASDLIPLVEQIDPFKKFGKIKRVVGIMLESQGPSTSIGDVCYIYTGSNGKKRRILAEVIGFKDEHVILMPYSNIQEISPGSLVESLGKSLEVKAGQALIGQVIDAMGQPLDGSTGSKGLVPVKTEQEPPNPLSRPTIREVIPVGVRAIDSMLTVGKGQRIGIFAGSGVGKSTLLGMMAKETKADVNVIALIGERGREVKEFIERDLGEEGLKKSVVVAATSDQPALMRIKGALTATAIAEYFRDQGLSVLLMMDSVTRVAMAQREIGLAIGEPPTTKGYTPSVFALLPRLLERTGTSEKGSITAFYTVLVDGDDMNEPIADTVRGILDGHFVLNRTLANQGHFPAIDILQSVSRLMNQLVSKGHLKAAEKLRETYSKYLQSEDLIQIGAYKKGSSREIDEAIRLYPKIKEFLKQATNEPSSFDESIQHLQQVIEEGSLS